ncbi:hypothetical protein L1987_28849 [Smallanthus sonchifolius]|uniref:Uncharacterized protein n=1 Tax=Smallanthus sonchifolius TaxID=185202 RepID=A0ACB9HZT8_9ASTR|nr:hypothetical protein L1987_28849 [Smallanthus sonchifolius]
MATRLLFASVPKTHSNTKTSQHLTPFSAVATPLFLRISRLEASRILETIYEEETALISTTESVKGVADHVVTTSASFLVSNRSTCFGQMKKQLSNNSENVFPMKSTLISYPKDRIKHPQHRSYDGRRQSRELFARVQDLRSKDSIKDSIKDIFNKQGYVISDHKPQVGDGCNGSSTSRLRSMMCDNSTMKLKTKNQPD